MIKFGRPLLKTPDWYLYYVSLNFEYLFEAHLLSNDEAKKEYEHIEAEKPQRLANFKRLLIEWGLPTEMNDDSYRIIDSFVARNITSAKANKDTPSILWLSFMFDLGLLIEEHARAKYPTLKVGVYITRATTMAGRRQRLLYGFDVSPEIQAGRNLPLEMVRHGFSLLEKNANAWELGWFVEHAIENRML